ncbi:MAG: hypothetical protein Q9M45_03330 [Robiginitomaculum sp.]|nr:hypothetical protein [Robiginitomaculum sp.]
MITAAERTNILHDPDDYPDRSCNLCRYFCAGVWRDSIPREPGNPTLFSWKPVYMLALVVGILMLVHIANMFGIHTGKFRGKF